MDVIIVMGECCPICGTSTGLGVSRAPFHCALSCAAQGVIEFSLCLLFAKLVSYTFLYWLPLYISNVGESVQGEEEPRKRVSAAAGRTPDLGLILVHKLRKAEPLLGWDFFWEGGFETRGSV